MFQGPAGPGPDPSAAEFGLCRQPIQASPQFSMGFGVGHERPFIISGLLERS